jgi:predicted phosphodiesterase
MRSRLLVPFVAACSLAACSAPTSYHLIAAGDALKVLVTADAPPADWAKGSFDDSAWSPLSASQVGPLTQDPTGAMPSVALRRRFDVGAEAAAYRNLTLTVTTEGSWTAFLNGKQVAVSGASSSAPVPFSVAALQPSGNVLAILVQPIAGTSMLDLGVQLDGGPDATAAAAPQVVRGPWLTSPSPTGITVVWETNVAVASTLIVDGHAYDGGAGAHHSVTVTDLEPSKSYPYHVEVNGTASPESQLTTAAKPGERVRFVVYGDDRTNGDAHRRIVDAIEAEGPDFTVNTGDLVDSSTDGEWNDFFNLEYPLLLHTPIFPTLGNHEAASSGGARFVELFPMDGRVDSGTVGGDAFGADFGDVHLAAIDSNGDLGKQATWLDQDLTQATARGATHLFVFLHWGPYSSGTMLLHGSNDDAEPIARVAKAHGVDALFSGHDHFYERGQSDNLIYFVTGGGGAPLMSAGHIDQTRVTNSAYHYLVVDVAGSSAVAVAKDPSGTAFDSYQLKQ